MIKPCKAILGDWQLECWLGVACNYLHLPFTNVMAWMCNHV